MTTATLASWQSDDGHGSSERPRRSLEELVDQLIAAMFKVEEPAASQAATPTATAPQSVVRSVHEARRLRQAGDVDGALVVLGGVDTAQATPREVRWAFSEWKQLVKRRFGRQGRPGLQPKCGQGRRGCAPGRRRDAGGGRGPGDALEAGQAGLGAQPPGASAPDRRCVMVTANVDIPALKARHPLGDTVEASGVRLRGRGRVRQGVCPFHDEVEGSFTVYADSERFYCFGCGEGGDVLDFIQKSEGLTLPEAIARLDGSPGLAPGAANRPARTRRPSSAALPPRDPHTADGGGALLRRMSPAFDRSAGVPGLAGRRPGRRRPPRSRLLAGRRSAAGP